MNHCVKSICSKHCSDISVSFGVQKGTATEQPLFCISHYRGAHHIGALGDFARIPNPNRLAGFIICGQRGGEKGKKYSITYQPRVIESRPRIGQFLTEKPKKNRGTRLCAKACHHLVSMFCLAAKLHLAKLIVLTSKLWLQSQDIRMRLWEHSTT